ncbi:response regulator transcription factor [Mesorhizobium yinganensis]|uniref:response regulator transcription factor n=1 Tax=Mesorhizobium yinganensis TaxID=3157707 RepID=UPI003CCE25DC
MPTITIIDDDDEVRVATENLIQSYGLEAKTFTSAEAFLESPMVCRTACLITDVQMPGMSGIDLQCALRARGCTVPMIFITAFPEERLRKRAEAAGAFGFLSKPFEAASLMSCVDKALAQNSP